jgi:Aldose 1-epimerase
VLNQRPGDNTTFAARAYDPRSGRIIDCFSTEPGLQVYTSNRMNGSVVGSSGTTYRQTEAFTLETQHFPDSPNKPNFPITELKPGQDFHSTTIFHFATPPCRHCRAEGRLLRFNRVHMMISVTCWLRPSTAAKSIHRGATTRCASGAVQRTYPEPVAGGLPPCLYGPRWSVSEARQHLCIHSWPSRTNRSVSMVRMIRQRFAVRLAAGRFERKQVPGSSALCRRRGMRKSRPLLRNLG